MLDLAVIALLVTVFVVAFKARRRAVDQRRERARTVNLVIDADGVERRLGDGREESVRWRDVVSVEVVCTPVRTADGASAFALVATGPDSGCLVPLGIGFDDDFVAGLVRLPGLRLQDYVAATEHRPPRRTVIWERQGAAGGDIGGTGNAP